MSKIIKLAAPALILPDRGIYRAMMEQPCQQQQGHFAFGFVNANAEEPSICTWNPSDKAAAITLTNNNLTATSSAGSAGVRGTVSRSLGKGYFELTRTGVVGANIMLGISAATVSRDNLLGNSDASSAGYWGSGSMRANSGTTNITGATHTLGDVISVAVDAPNHRIWFAKNGAWQNSGDPSAGTNGIDYITTAPVFPHATLYGAYGVTANFGASPFAYAPPSGFTPWG